ncbi:MAG: 30S ribosomal protein S20 [Alphaproteobacteria bacterium]|nr:MAG: 30S ribosomal protein S20 [Alphaproteobacteria bacterium]
MAHHKSAKKRIRQIERRTEVRGARTSRIRTFVKKVETAILSGDKSAAQAAFQEAQPEIHRGVVRGILHRNTAARKLSRLSARIKAL